MFGGFAMKLHIKEISGYSISIWQKVVRNTFLLLNFLLFLRHHRGMPQVIEMIGIQTVSGILIFHHFYMGELHKINIRMG
mgnify:CR=1 FL=1